MTSPLISMQNIKKVFVTEELETHALTNINLSINAGEYVSISGNSGCGKSTLLSLLGLLDVASGGQYILNGTNTTELDEATRAFIRNTEIGFIFQSFNLISDMTVFENVALPLTYRKDLSQKQIAQMVNLALTRVNMQHRLKHYPAQLSGGQQQRVAIARAIAGNGSLILADEPTGNLDSQNAQDVMNILDELHANGATICMVTHDPRSAERAQRTIQISDGKIVTDQNNTANQTSQLSASA